MSTTKSELIGIDVVERRRSSWRLRRTSTIVWTVWSSLYGTQREQHMRCRATSEIVTPMKFAIYKNLYDRIFPEAGCRNNLGGSPTCSDRSREKKRTVGVESGVIGGWDDGGHLSDWNWWDWQRLSFPCPRQLCSVLSCQFAVTHWQNIRRTYQR